MVNLIENQSDVSRGNSSYLRVPIVESMLVACIDKSHFTDIYRYVQRVLPKITESEVREYLFCLINGSFIDYVGNSKIYCTSQEGIDLLNTIYSQKIGIVTDYSDLMIKVE